MTRPRSLRPIAAIAGAVLSLALAGAGNAQLSPDAQWRTFDTPNFVVHYEEGLEALARRAAARAEEARVQLAESFVGPPRGRVHLVVADNLDYSNGTASLFPRNRIVIYAHAPVDEPSLAYTHDWTELVVGHELAHVHHLDHARGPWGGLRPLLGRHPVTFPNALVPRWTTEGLATWLESRLTGAGRVHGSFHEMVLRTAVLEDRFFSIDRVSGGPVSWPGGSAAYVYGSLFHEHLAERYGADRAGAFVREMGGRWAPYRLDDAARESFGVSFTRAWGAWEAELRARYAAVADSLRAAGLTEPVLLTAAGRRVESPRWSPDGSRIAYAAATGRDEPSTRVVDADGVRVLAPRTTPGGLAWLPDGSGLVTAQLDFVERTRVWSDLYRVDAGGEVRRLTHGARLLAPDVSRDGRVVAVQGGGAWNALVVLDAAGGEPRTLVAAAPEVNWTAPRWSPDGTRVAAARMATGGRYDVVVLDTAGRVVREATADRALDLTPAWSPDGRWLVFSSDRTGIPNLFAFDLQSGELRQVTNLLTGAFEPDVSPDGRSIAFLWYRADGYHVARIPFDPSSWRPAPPPTPELAAPGPDPARFGVGAGGPSRRYSALATLPPTSWSPVLDADTVVGTGIGASVAGSDVVGRHAYALSATAYPREGLGEGYAAYVYAGLGQPTVGGSVQQDWRVVRGAGWVPRGDSVATATPLMLRERSVSMAVTIQRPRFGRHTWVSTGVNLRRIHYAWLDPAAEPTRGVPELAPDLGWVLSAGRSTARTYDFSVSREDGWLAAGTVQGRRYARALGGDDAPRGYVRVAGRAAGYRALEGGGFARPVLAARLLAAADVGSRSPGFWAGGAEGGGFAGPLGTGLGLGSALDFPVRGYPEGSQAGDRALAGSLEARLPVALVERGYRLVPAFVERVWGAGFVDAGSAWCSEECPFGAPSGAVRPLVSVGAELGADLTFFFHGDLPLVVGVAVPLTEGATGARPRPGAYLRVGRSF